MSVGADITRTLTRYTLPRRSDAELAAAVAQALTGWTVRQDVPVGDYGDRIQMLVALPDDRGVAVCVTTGRRVERGTVHRRLQEIARHDDVAELVLVTTRTAHTTLPPSFDGKPLAVHLVRG